MPQWLIPGIVCGQVVNITLFISRFEFFGMLIISNKEIMFPVVIVCLFVC